VGCQRDVTIFHVWLEAGPVATVEHFEHPAVDLVVSNFFEQINETSSDCRRICFSSIATISVLWRTRLPKK